MNDDRIHLCTDCDRDASQVLSHRTCHLCGSPLCFFCWLSHDADRIRSGDSSACRTIERQRVLREDLKQQ